MTGPQAHEHALIPVQVQVQAAAQVCEDKKGENTRILALDPVDSGLADFFLITSALNDRQAQTIADEVELKLKRDFGVLPASVEGRRHGGWILLDYVDFVVHVFLAERRAFYDIERLRKSARPLTPAEFDQELKAALVAKTRSVRGKAAASGERSSAGTKSAKSPARTSRSKKTLAGAASKPATKTSRRPAKKKNPPKN